MGAEQPFFSVVIPSRERPDRLSSCLDAFTHLDYPEDGFEVIVVDDGSREEPAHVIDRFSDQLPVRLVRQAHKGPATARNAGAAVARGEYLAFIDDDCAPAPDWLRRFAGRFVTSPHAMVGGRTINALPALVFSSASQMLIDYLYACYNAEPKKARFFTSNNMAVSTDDFRAVGGFDTRFPLAAAEDRDLCERWFRDGRPMIYIPEARVYHSHPLTFGGFWQQHATYGRGAHHFGQARSRRGQSAIRFEPVSFYPGMLWFPMSHGRGWHALRLATLLGIAQVANAAGFVRESLAQFRRRDPHDQV
jgi:glycosyltransferase involved in cell wall biosynthesis